MRVNLIAWDNGVGLSRDMCLIRRALEAADEVVNIQPARGRGKLRKWFGPYWQHCKTWWHFSRHGKYQYDVNLHLEHIKPEFLRLARWNFFIPNPEWCEKRDVRLLPKVERVLVKTRHAMAIYEGLGCEVKLIGFTSEDRYDGGHTPRKRAFFHLAGRSSSKQTDVLLKTWLQHPEWPVLTVLQHPSKATGIVSANNIHHRVDYIDDAELKQLQNEHLFHVCPSETEGFGHYIMEALSVGAVVMTTNAEPMNEFISAERGILIPYVATKRQNMATCYLVDAGGIELAVQQALALADDDIARRSSDARAFYVASFKSFRERLPAAMTQALNGLNQGLCEMAS